jgi:hypothetical protein
MLSRKYMVLLGRFAEEVGSVALDIPPEVHNSNHDQYTGNPEQGLATVIGEGETCRTTAISTCSPPN